MVVSRADGEHGVDGTSSGSVAAASGRLGISRRSTGATAREHLILLVRAVMWLSTTTGGVEEENESLLPTCWGSTQPWSLPTAKARVAPERGGPAASAAPAGVPPDPQAASAASAAAAKRRRGAADVDVDSSVGVLRCRPGEAGRCGVARRRAELDVSPRKVREALRPPTSPLAPGDAIQLREASFITTAPSWVRSVGVRPDNWR
jgi:hypothetical protein